MSGAYLGMFIEIELKEGVDWKSNKEALKTLTRIEKSFKRLGIGPNKRVQKSLWELYRIN